MEMNEDKSVQFVLGEFVCVVIDGEEHCGDIIEVEGEQVVINSNHGGQIKVFEGYCYPG